MISKLWPLPWLLLPHLSPLVRDRIGFALRQWLTAMLALYICFVLQLESPYWALLAVWIVAQPTPGMVLSKSIYFVLGTIIGAILGLTLIAAFAQTPELFVLGLALLVAGCTVASNLLTNFRAYGTVLIGYTAGIVAAGSINAPDQVFFLAMARATAILTGISCSILVTAVFAPYRSETLAREKMQAALKDAAHRAGYAWTAENKTRLDIGRKLIVDLIALNTFVEFASAESATFRLHTDQARSLIAHIFATISARRSLDAHLIRSGWPQHAGLEAFHGVILDFLNEMPQQVDRGEVDELIAQIDELRGQLARLQPEDEGRPAENLVSERLVIDRLDDLLLHLGGALRDWRDILQGIWWEKPHLNLNFHRDHRAAWINGLRAFLAVSAMGAFWIASAWDHGTLALVFTAVLMSLFSSLPHPEQVGWNFLKSGVAAVFIGLIWKFLVLPHSSAFEFLTVALGLIFVPLAFVMSKPATAQMALSFAFVFVYIIRPDNAMTYDLTDSVNTGVAVLVGVLFGALSYTLIFPPDSKAARRYVTRRICTGLAMLAQHEPIPQFCTWETRMYDRVSRLNDPSNLSGSPTDEWLDAGLGALTLGNEILRLRCCIALEDASPQIEQAVHETIAAFGEFVRKPQEAVSTVKNQIKTLFDAAPGIASSDRRSWARVLGGLMEMDSYLSLNPVLIKRGGRAGF